MPNDAVASNLPSASVESLPVVDLVTSVDRSPATLSLASLGGELRHPSASCSRSPVHIRASRSLVVW